MYVEIFEEGEMKFRTIVSSVAVSVLAVVGVSMFVFVSKAYTAEVQNEVKRKGPFGTEIVIRPIEKTYSEKVSANPALVFKRSLEFLNSIDGAKVTSEGEAKRVAKANGKLKCRMPWSFGMEIDAEYSFDLELSVAGSGGPTPETAELKLRFTNVVVDPRHPDLPEGISKFEKSCLDQTRDAILKLVSLP